MEEKQFTLLLAGFVTAFLLILLTVAVLAVKTARRTVKLDVSTTPALFIGDAPPCQVHCAYPLKGEYVVLESVLSAGAPFKTQVSVSPKQKIQTLIFQEFPGQGTFRFAYRRKKVLASRLALPDPSVQVLVRPLEVNFDGGEEAVVWGGRIKVDVKLSASRWARPHTISVEVCADAPPPGGAEPWRHTIFGSDMVAVESAKLATGEVMVQGSFFPPHPGTYRASVLLKLSSAQDEEVAPTVQAGIAAINVTRPTVEPVLTEPVTVSVLAHPFVMNCKLCTQTLQSDRPFLRL
jgi:hypothetical protein